MSIVLNVKDLWVDFRVRFWVVKRNSIVFFCMVIKFLNTQTTTMTDEPLCIRSFAMPSSVKWVCFTLNNYNDGGVARTHAIPCSYVITIFETAPSTGNHISKAT